MSLILKIAAGVILALVLLIAGCTALLAASAEEVTKELDKMGTGTVQVYAPSSKTWSGAIGSATRDGSGNATFRVEDELVVTAVVQKQSPGGWSLRVKIMQDGETVDDQLTNAEYGVVTVTS